MNDVLFQADPFSIDSQKIYCSCEGYNISDNNFAGNLNRNWITYYYSKFFPHVNVLQKYVGKKIICCGTIIGPTAPIVDYLKWYTTINKGEVRWYSFLHKSTFRFRCMGQALYNIYCYNNPDKCIIQNQNEGLILTCGEVDYNSVKKSPSGQLLNDKHEVYPILHQMDRWGPEKVTLLENIAMNAV